VVPGAGPVVVPVAPELLDPELDDPVLRLLELPEVPELVVAVPPLEEPEVVVCAAVAAVETLVAAFAVELAPSQAHRANRTTVATPCCNILPFKIFCMSSLLCQIQRCEALCLTNQLEAVKQSARRYLALQVVR
jgi:hypothetical protein